MNLTDQFPLAGDLDEFFFTASAGDVVDVLTTSTSIYPCFTLFAPDATTTWTRCYGGYETEELRTPALPLAGTYTIFLWDQYNSVGGYGSSSNASPALASSPLFQTSLDISRSRGHRWRISG